MTEIAAIRGFGGEIWLDEAGAPKVKGITKAMASALSSKRQAIVLALKQEQNDFLLAYHQSALYWHMGEMFDSLKRLEGHTEASEQIEETIEYLTLIDNAGCNSGLAAAKELAASLASEAHAAIAQIVNGITLEGEALAKVARAAFAPKANAAVFGGQS